MLTFHILLLSLLSMDIVAHVPIANPRVQNPLVMPSFHRNRRNHHHLYRERWIRAEASDSTTSGTQVDRRVHVSSIGIERKPDHKDVGKSVPKPPFHGQEQSEFPFRDLVLFGDSLTGPLPQEGADNDDGTLLCDGRVWWQHMADDISRQFGGKRVNIVNYARAWSTVLDTPSMPSLSAQIEQFLLDRQLYLEQNPELTPSAKGRAYCGKGRLYVIWAGANDLTVKPLRKWQPIVTQIHHHIRTILSVDPDASILVPTMIPGDETPSAMRVSTAVRAGIRKRLEGTYGPAYRGMMNELRTELGPNRVIEWDADGFLRHLLKNPEQYGLRDNRDDILQVLKQDGNGNGENFQCLSTDPEGVFVDGVHMSTHVHALLAQNILRAILAAQ